jgi:hypothetical protein
LATEKLLVVVCCRIGLTEITGARMLPRWPREISGGRTLPRWQHLTMAGCGCMMFTSDVSEKEENVAGSTCVCIAVV